MKIYLENLKINPLHFVEVGIFGGGSLFMWKNIFILNLE